LRLVNRHVKTVLAAFVISLTPFGGEIAVSAAGNRDVILKDIVFTPTSLTIRAGSSVTFQFMEPDTDHNVISRGSKRFKSISARATGSVKRTFRHGGVYRYECTLHPGMDGRIIVR